METRTKIRNSLTFEFLLTWCLADRMLAPYACTLLNSPLYQYRRHGSHAYSRSLDACIPMRGDFQSPSATREERASCAHLPRCCRQVHQVSGTGWIFLVRVSHLRTPPPPEIRGLTAVIVLRGPSCVVSQCWQILRSCHSSFLALSG